MSLSLFHLFLPVFAAELFDSIIIGLRLLFELLVLFSVLSNLV